MKYFKFSLRILILIGLDLISKYLFYNLRYLEDTSLIRPVINTGISRSLPVPFLIIILISIVGIWLFIRLYVKNKLSRITTAFLIAGTIGNFIDRIIYGWVRDFINVGLFNFPIFNFADIMLSIWVGLRIIKLMLEKKK